MGFISILFSLGNLKNAWRFLLENWKPILFLTVLGILTYQNLSTWQFLLGLDTLPSLRQELVDYEKAVEQLETANKTLSDAIERRNEEVQMWKSASEQSEKEIAKLEEEINDIKEQTDETVKETLNDPTPKTCKEAFEYLSNGIEDLKWN